MVHEEIKVSVIVPVYKVEPYLCQCVDSVLSQTHQNIEVILVDDGSPDGCPQICDEYAGKDVRVKVIHKENGGLSSARNTGLDRMSGKYVMFVDSDDWIDADMVSHLLHIAIEEECDAVSTGIYRAYSRQQTVIQRTEEALRAVSGIELLNDFYQGALWETNIVMCHLYRVELFSDLRFTEDTLYEDSIIQFPLLYGCKKIVRSNQCFYHYYFSPDSILRSGFSEKRFDSLRAYEFQMDFCREHGLGDLYEQAKVHYYLRLAHLRYDMYAARWPKRAEYLPMLAKKETRVRDAVKSKYYTPKMRIKRVMFNHLQALTKLTISVKRKIDRKRLELAQRREAHGGARA